MKYFSRKVIRKDFLLSNYKTLKKISGTNICAVVKANAYSHGDQTVCKILKEDCNFFAVQNLEEAIKIRKVNKTAINFFISHSLLIYIAYYSMKKKKYTLYSGTSV